MANLRQIAKKLDEAIDQSALKTGIDRFSSASARLDAGLAQIDPILKDLSSPVDHRPATDIGQADPANQHRRRRSRAPVQQAAERPRRSQHGRDHPEAADPGGAARQLQRDGDRRPRRPWRSSRPSCQRPVLRRQGLTRSVLITRGVSIAIASPASVRNRRRQRPPWTDRTSS